MAQSKNTGGQKEPIFAEPNPAVSPARPELEKDLFVWTAPTRPFKRRDREYYVTLIAIAGIVGLVLFLVEGFMPVILIVSLVFLYYILNTVEPGNVEYKITNFGLKIGETKIPWLGLGRYWFSRRFDSDLLIIETANLPGRLELVIFGRDKEKIRKVLGNYLNEEALPPSFLDKAAGWVAKKLPGNH